MSISAIDYYKIIFADLNLYFFFYKLKWCFPNNRKINGHEEIIEIRGARLIKIVFGQHYFSTVIISIRFIIFDISV